jgi:hypothetical protein
MSGRKSRNTGGDDSERKHLTGARGGTAAGSHEGQPERSPRPVPVAPALPARPNQVAAGGADQEGVGRERRGRLLFFANARVLSATDTHALLKPFARLRP